VSALHGRAASTGQRTTKKPVAKATGRSNNRSVALKPQVVKVAKTESRVNKSKPETGKPETKSKPKLTTNLKTTIKPGPNSGQEEFLIRKPASVAVAVRTEIHAEIGSRGISGGAATAVALQRLPEPELLEFDPLEDEDDLDDEIEPSADFEVAARRLTHPFESITTHDYDPTAQMTPEQRRAMRDQVVIEHLPLVRAIAVRVHENLPVHVELDDLVHAGIMGLFDASSKYNPEKRVAFSSYAKHRIKGAILDSLRQLDWASRDLRRRHKQIEQATRELASTLHRNPTEEEVAGKMGVEVDRWRQMMLDLRNVGLISASTRGTEHDDLPAPDFPAKPELQPDSMCAYEQLKGLLATAMQVLPERYKKVVLMYYKNEFTMKEIGQHLGINESRVSQIHKSALEKMANALQQAGIASSQAF
jgi:RNA polymerase sigma factor FliA